MTNEEFKKKMAGIQWEIDCSRAKMTLLKDKFMANCPMKIGDYATVNSCGFKGKNIVIDEIYIINDGGVWKWSAIGYLVLAVGIISEQRRGKCMVAI